LTFLLLTQTVQNQIKSLTSGTSASHNRIKTAELAKVRIPIPKPDSKADKQLRKIVYDYKKSFERLIRETINLADLRSKEMEWME
jgi:phosphatidylserine/phosphatidylglycerophosphate/cardiolipin synthase-like enzyme